MREILFRGKCVDDGEWVEGQLLNVLCYLDDKPQTFIAPVNVTLYPHFEVCGMTEVDPETVGQFTGLLDKNGAKIFEGDVVKTKYGRLCIVVWFSNQVHNGWDLETVRTVENCVHTKPPTVVDLYKKDNLEIVGNIYDNPEWVNLEL